MYYFITLCLINQPFIKIHIANESSIYDLTEEEKNHETEIALENYSNFDYDIRNKTEEEIKKEIETIILKEGIQDEFKR